MAILKIADLVKSGGPYIGPKGGVWADPQHTVPWKSDHEDTTSHLFHSTPAYAMSRIKREGLAPRKGAGLFQHGGYDLHSQGKVFLSNNLYAAKQWHSKVEAQLEHHHDNPKHHVAVMLRVKPRETHLDDVGDRDVSGSRFVRDVVPATDIEFFHEGTKRWKPVKDYKHGTHGIPDDHYEAHAPRDEEADAAEKAAAKEARRAKREAEEQATRARLAALQEERAKREAAEAQVHFRDSDEGKAILTRWKGLSPEERQAKAKRILDAPRPFPGAPSMLSLGQRGEVWREALGVDEKGNLVKSRFIIKAGPSGGGWMPIPGGHHGGLRRRHGAGWEYWYPNGAPHFVPREQKHPEEQHGHEQIDPEPSHWALVTPGPGLPPVGWTAGGVNPHDTKTPVKEAGVSGKLYRIKNPHIREGWALLTDVRSGEDHMVQHDRVMPVRWLSPEERALQGSTEPQEPFSTWKPGVGPSKRPSGGGASEGKRMPSFPDSRALPGTETHKLENGAYVWRKVTRYEADEDGTTRKVERLAPGIPDSDKIALIAEYEGLVAKTAKRVRSAFGLSARLSTGPGQRTVDDTLVELRQAGVEGLLHAIDSYRPVGPFAAHAQQYVRDYARLHAAREFAGGIAIPRRHARLLSSYIAARAEAARVSGSHDPSPEVVAEFWKPKKRDLHSGLSPEEGGGTIPLAGYTLKRKTTSTDPETGKKKTTVEGEDVVQQPGRLEWAQQFHAFLVGQGGMADIDEQAALFPGLGVGTGLGADERIAVREAMMRALPPDGTIVTVQAGPQAQFRGETWKAIDLALGLSSGDPLPLDEVVRRVPVEGSRGGEWKRLGSSRARAAIEALIRDGLNTVARHLRGDEDRAASLAQALVTKLVPTEAPKERLPTMRERIRAAMARITPAEVQRWREETRARYPERPDIGRRMSRVTDSEAKRRIVEERIAAAPLTPEMHEAMLRTMTAIRQGVSASGQNVFGVVDPKGSKKSLRVHSLSKAGDHGASDSAMVGEWLRFPELSRLRWASEDPLVHAPTIARARFDSIIG